MKHVFATNDLVKNELLSREDIQFESSPAEGYSQLIKWPSDKKAADVKTELVENKHIAIYIIDKDNVVVETKL